MSKGDWIALMAVVLPVLGGMLTALAWFVKQSINQSMTAFELRMRSWLAKDYVNRQELDLLLERRNERVDSLARQLAILRRAEKKG